MKCEACEEQLNALLDRELSLRQALTVGWHLAACDTCRTRCRQYRAIRRAARKVYAPRRNRQVAWPLIGWATGAAAAAALLVLWSWGEPVPHPAALVFDARPMSGKAKPISEIYAQDGKWVLRQDNQPDMTLDLKGKPADRAIQIVNIATGTPLPSAVELNLKASANGDVLVVDYHAKADRTKDHTVVIFSGPASVVAETTIPDNKPVYFVQILDPKIGIVGDSSKSSANNSGRSDHR